MDLNLLTRRRSRLRGTGCEALSFENLPWGLTEEVDNPLYRRVSYPFSSVKGVASVDGKIKDRQAVVNQSKYG
jgi:hypothetical protein